MGKQQHIKQDRKTEKAKEADYLARRELFFKEMTELSAKYKIDLVGALQYKDTALIPVIVMVDAADKYGHVTQEAKEDEAQKETNGKLVL